MMKAYSVPSLESWLLQEIPANSLEFAWVGQAGFLFKTNKVRLGIDLYLSDSLATKYQGREFPHKRMVDVPILPDALTNLDIVFCSHGHTDHMDEQTLAPLFNETGGPLIVAPRSEMSRLLKMGIPAQRIVGMSDKETFETQEGITIHAIAAAHDTLAYDRWGQSMALGFVVDLGFVSWYHSGDTVLYPSLADAIQQKKPAICLLPVNGRKPHLTQKGIIGNLTIAEAGKLALAVGSSLLVPHHYGMFDFNTVDEKDIIRQLELQGLKRDDSYILASINTIYSYSRIRK